MQFLENSLDYIPMLVLAGLPINDNITHSSVAVLSLLAILLNYNITIDDKNKVLRIAIEF